ncbi:hypothetical protein V1512DRAFT_202460 [Lipomyces arxii]|uniref:uncharacterized protein n=1 Tax=Lipomyces arxii TaxID=56418 RepID=UPI0034CFB497
MIRQISASRVRSLHSNVRRDAYFDFWRNLRPKKDDTVEEKRVKARQEQLREETGPVLDEVVETESELNEVAETESSGVKLNDVDWRVSKIKARFAENVDDLDTKGLEDGKIYEIGFKRPTRRWKEQLSDFSVSIWKRRSPVYDMAEVRRLAGIIIAEDMKLISIEWPMNGKRTVTGDVDEDEFEKIARQRYEFKLAVKIEEYSLVNLYKRFNIVKRLSQLTGRTVPDSIFTGALSMKEILRYYEIDRQRHEKYGLFQDDPYNPYVTKLYIDPKRYEGTNVAIIE